MKWASPQNFLECTVHSPQKCSTGLCNSLLKAEEYISYKVTTKSSSIHDPSPAIIAVNRRFSDFSKLKTVLGKKYHLYTINLPELPTKHFAARFERRHVLSRQKALQIYIDSLVGHPLLCVDPLILAFLCIDGIEGETYRHSYFEDSVVIASTPVNVIIISYKWIKGFEISGIDLASFYDNTVILHSLSFINLTYCDLSSLVDSDASPRFITASNHLVDLSKHLQQDSLCNTSLM